MVNRPTFWAFETAKRAIANSQLGLDTVGHNMANINTPGYTRQRVDQVSWNISGNSKFVINKSFYTGMGAIATGVSQIRDPFLDARYRAESSDFGEYVVTQAGYEDLKNIFDEYKANTGLTISIGEFIDSITTAMGDPTSKENATVVQAKAKEFITTLNRYAEKLSGILDQNHEDIGISIDDELNPKLQEIAELNEKIWQSEIYGNPANELKDRRNYLLDEISGFVDIHVTETPDANLLREGIHANRVTVTINGSTGGTGPNGEIVLVKENECGQFSYKRNADDTLSIEYEDHTGAAYDDVKMDATLKTGALRGYLDFVNGDGDEVAGNTRGIPYAQKYLDNLAQAFADALNTVNTSIAWKEDDGTGTITDMQGVTLIEANDGSGTITAANIALTAAWRDDVQQIILGFPADNSFDTSPAAKFKDALENQSYNIIPHQTKPMKFHEAITNFQGIIGMDLSITNNLLSTSNQVLGGIEDQRQAVSGVSENEEAIDMMIYSNHYNAAVRYMTTLDEALDTIINNMGLVGR